MVLEKLLEARAKRGGAFLLLIDPDRLPESQIPYLIETAQEVEVDAFLVGTSFMLYSNFHQVVRQIKQHAAIPVIIFPGSHSQISPDADAILFMSLLSGRNPQYLIDEQVKGAPLVKEFGLEVIPTGYLLVASGLTTSVQYISNTQPLPRDKNDIACAHALAAQFLGMQLLYLDAGSGAEHAVPEEMITAVTQYSSLPLQVGGGLRAPEDIERKLAAGASFVVVGNQFEDKMDRAMMREFVAAAHPLEKVSV